MGIVVDVLKEFDGHKVGDTVRVTTVPMDANNPHWVEHRGKVFYNNEVGDLVFVDKSFYRPAHRSLEDMLKLEITHTEPGVQDMGAFFNSFSLSDYDFMWSRNPEFESEFKSEFIKRWLCTDTHVGYGFLYMNGKRVAFFSQSGRKSNCEYYWLSPLIKEDVYHKAKSYLTADEENFNLDVLRDDFNFINWMV